RGRGRPRGSDAGRTRHHIVATARTMFSERGYAATSLRAIDGQAGVDASLISHYFGNKSGLFFETMALPVDPVAAKRRVFRAGLDGAGARIVEAIVNLWDPHHEVLAMLIRNACDRTAPNSDALTVAEHIMIPHIHADLRGPNRRERADLIAAQLIGMASIRYVFELEPLASAPPSHVAQIYGPALQQLLTPDV